MSRPRCFICFKQLMYVHGLPVFAIFKDEGGVEHRVHKDCLKHEQREHDAELTKRHRMSLTKPALVILALGLLGRVWGLV